MSSAPLRAALLAALSPALGLAAQGKVASVPIELGTGGSAPIGAPAAVLPLSPAAALSPAPASLTQAPAGLTQAPAGLAAAPASLPASAVPVERSAPAVARRGFLDATFGRLTRAVGSILSINTPLAEKAARRETPPAELSASSGRLFEGAPSRRGFLKAAALGAAIVCVGGCESPTVDDYWTPPDGGTPGDSLLDTRFTHKDQVLEALNTRLRPMEAFPAHLGFNTWDAQYHLGWPHWNDYLIDSVAYTGRAVSFEGGRAFLSALPVDQAVSSKLVFLEDRTWGLFANGAPSDYWVSEWWSVPYLYGPDDVQAELNGRLTGAESFDAKVAGDVDGRVRLAYPIIPLDSDNAYYWDYEAFDTFIEAMSFAQGALSDYQNRGLKLYYSPLDLVYYVFYPASTSTMSQKLEVPEGEMAAAVEQNSRLEPAPAPESVDARGPAPAPRRLVDWKGVFRSLGKSPAR